MAAEGLYFPELHLEYTPPVEELQKICSVRGCRRFVDPNAQTKMCEECRGRHRVYATTKRMRRKLEKAAIQLQASMGGEDLQNPDWNSSGVPAEVRNCVLVKEIGDCNYAGSNAGMGLCH